MEWFLPKDQYTFENILAWGLCEAHMTKAHSEETISQKERLYHGILGFCEIIPVFGQIVSGLEALAQKAHEVWQKNSPAWIQSSLTYLSKAKRTYQGIKRQTQKILESTVSALIQPLLQTIVAL